MQTFENLILQNCSGADPGYHKFRGTRECNNRAGVVGLAPPLRCRDFFKIKVILFHFKTCYLYNCTAFLNQSLRFGFLGNAMHN